MLQECQRAICHSVDFNSVLDQIGNPSVSEMGLLYDWYDISDRLTRRISVMIPLPWSLYQRWASCYSALLQFNITARLQEQQPTRVGTPFWYPILKHTIYIDQSIKEWRVY